VITANINIPNSNRRSSAQFPGEDQRNIGNSRSRRRSKKIEKMTWATRWAQTRDGSLDGKNFTKPAMDSA